MPVLRPRGTDDTFCHLSFSSLATLSYVYNTHNTYLNFNINENLWNVQVNISVLL